MFKVNNKDSRTTPMALMSILQIILKKTSKCTMEVKRLRLLALEIFKAFNENCPSFIKDYSEKNENSVSEKYDLKKQHEIV